MSGTELVRYDAMCQAIAAAFDVDEVKEIRDQAMAFEVYARQARNVEAETKACEIRLRAERKCGQLLRRREMAKGGGDKRPDHRSQRATGDTAPLSAIGISKTQSSRWQKLAEITDKDFEATFANADAKPTTTGLIAANEKSKPPVIEIDPNAVWLWGRLLDFERMGLLAADPNDIFATMIEHMQETVTELAPQVALWLGRLNPP